MNELLGRGVAALVTPDAPNHSDDGQHQQDWIDEQEINADIAFSSAEDARMHQKFIARVARPQEGENCAHPVTAGQPQQSKVARSNQGQPRVCNQNAHESFSGLTP